MKIEKIKTPLVMEHKEETEFSKKEKGFNKLLRNIGLTFTAKRYYIEVEDFVIRVFPDMEDILEAHPEAEDFTPYAEIHYWDGIWTINDEGGTNADRGYANTGTRKFTNHLDPEEVKEALDAFLEKSLKELSY